MERHRWIAFMEGRKFVCHPLAGVLSNNGKENVCHGCHAEIAFSKFPEWKDHKEPETVQIALDELFRRGAAL